MRPAFSSPQQAAVFALLLLLLLLSPALAGRKFLPPREDLYKFQGYGIAPLPWIYHQIYQETNAIDVAFIGSSRLLHDIDTPYVQEQFSRRLGRPAVVRSICWGGSGYDILYLIARDLLAHRRVGMLVFYDEDGARFRNPLVPYFFRWADDKEALAGLSLRDQAVFYFVAMQGIPRNIMARLRSEIPQAMDAKPNCFETVFRSPNPANRLGSVSAQRGFDPDFGVCAPFISFKPDTGIKSSDDCVYSEPTSDKWNFLNLTLPAWQTHFARKFAELATANGCKLVMLHVPAITEAESPVITERVYWPQILGANLVMVGIPTARLFEGLTSDEVHRLYFDPKHFNQNGQEFFTAIITPVLLQIHETQVNP